MDELIKVNAHVESAAPESSELWERVKEAKKKRDAFRTGTPERLKLHADYMTAKRAFNNEAKRRSRALVEAANKVAKAAAEQIVANNPPEVIEERIEQAENPTGKAAQRQQNIDSLNPEERAKLDERIADFDRYRKLLAKWDDACWRVRNGEEPAEDTPTAADMELARAAFELKYPPVVTRESAYHYLETYGLALDSYAAVGEFRDPSPRPVAKGDPMPPSGVRRLPQIFKDKDGTQMQWAVVSGGNWSHVLVSTGCDDATVRRIAGASSLGPVAAPSPAQVKSDAENVAAQDEVQQVVAESQMTPLQRFEKFQAERRNEILRLAGRSL